MPDRDRLIDMLHAAEDARSFVAEVTREAFDTDKKTQYAVARALEILGEAATQVDEDGRSLHPDIPWRDIAGLRVVLAHQYFRIDPDVVWDIVTTQLEPLIGQLEAIIPPEEP